MTRKVYCLTLTLVFFHQSLAFAQSARNIPEAGAGIAEKLASRFQGNEPEFGQATVAVLPFGDKNARSTVRIENLSKQMQAAILERLGPALENLGLGQKFAVPSLERLEGILDTIQGGPIGFYSQDLGAVRGRMAAGSIDVIVRGRFPFDGETVGGVDGVPEPTSITTELIFQTGQPITVSQDVVGEAVSNSLSGGDANPIDPNPDNPDQVTLDGRLDIDFFGQPQGSNLYEKIPLRIVRDSTSPFFNMLYLRVKHSDYYGQRYQIRIANKGGNKIGFVQSGEDSDDDRILSVAVYVDGVCAIKRRVVRPDGIAVYRKDQRHPAFVSRWVLTSPGRRLHLSENEDNIRLKGAKVVSTNGAGNSFVLVEGFLEPPQGRVGGINEGFVRPFQFANAANSVGAEQIGGARSQIGLISIFVFAEQMPNDVSLVQQVHEDIGTSELPPEPTKVGKVVIKNLYKAPPEQYHILYRYDNDPNPPDDLVIID